MKARTEFILETAIKDFIRTGRPVSSLSLFRNYDFKIKPAMIRWELKDLTDKGFFYKCYSSGGRIPTDKAYKFLVNKILSDFFHEDFLQFNYDFESLIEKTVKELKLFVLAYHFNLDKVYQFGLRFLLENFELLKIEEKKMVFCDLDYLPYRINKFLMDLKKIKDWPQIFIGRNFLLRSNYLSLIIEKLEDERKNKFFLFMVGPKRMDYQKSINYFKNLC